MMLSTVQRKVKSIYSVSFCYISGLRAHPAVWVVSGYVLSEHLFELIGQVLMKA